MSGFQESIKNFDKIRDYMRQFFLYGFKVRTEFQDKSPRTYDNERRRIENYLAPYIHGEYTAKGKQVSIRINPKHIFSNPLYAAWKSKSFTDRDLLLHFFLLDLLFEGQVLSPSKLCDQISLKYGETLDVQTVRLKCREYEKLGILCSVKEGKSLSYKLASPLAFEKTGPLREHLLTAVKFCSEAMPFGFVGNTLLDREFLHNDRFCFKHGFLVHTLEDEILLRILSAMREHRYIRFVNHSSRSGLQTTLFGLPLKIFVSTRTGRRYLCLYFEPRRRFNCLRLDCISQVEALEFCPGYENLQKKLSKNLPNCWGVSFGGRSRMETLCLKLQIDEKTESYLLNRLKREGRGGEILRICENTFLYTGTFYDANEMLNWVKTFTGRILDVQCSNVEAQNKLTADLDILYRMYADRGASENA